MFHKLVQHILVWITHLVFFALTSVAETNRGRLFTTLFVPYCLFVWIKSEEQWNDYWTAFMFENSKNSIAQYLFTLETEGVCLWASAELHHIFGVVQELLLQLSAASVCCAVPTRLKHRTVHSSQLCWRGRWPIRSQMVWYAKRLLPNRQQQLIKYILSTLMSVKLHYEVQWGEGDRGVYKEQCGNITHQL